MTPYTDAERARIRNAIAQCRTHPEMLALIADARAAGMRLTVAYQLTLGSPRHPDFGTVSNIRIDNRLMTKETTAR